MIATAPLYNPVDIASPNLLGFHYFYSLKSATVHRCSSESTVAHHCSPDFATTRRSLLLLARVYCCSSKSVARRSLLLLTGSLETASQMLVTASGGPRDGVKKNGDDVRVGDSEEAQRRFAS
ncbi:hypothetical protein Tco_0774860 [Tanacetum coccineum]|uniref:Uncharacterized protein n=1 Tax=Tanacetum coccineum TaxID=301880 RepID=A0ABQ4ZPP3_9ASTR